MSACSRVVARMVILCVLIACVALFQPVKAEAFSCGGGPVCVTSYRLCLAACGSDTQCTDVCQQNLQDCCNPQF
jgi:hypothetical protein